MNIIFLGPQGSGKGTQAKVLAEKFGLFYLSTGEMFREIQKTNQEIAEMMNSGVLIPDELVIKYLFEYLESKKIYDNLVIDGTPRSVFQYEEINKWFATKGTKFNLAILLQISRAESIKRLSSRRQDKNTGKIYNLLTNPPGADVKAEDLTQREDDTPVAIGKRLDEYEEKTKPLIDVLREDGILVEVDGERPIDEIQQDLLAIVEKVKNAS